MLRELHTRFGRDNVGYLWLVIEPMILAFGVSIFHVVEHVQLPFGFMPGSFYGCGYITFIVFRNNVNRAAALVHSNKPLLFHKIVTLLDISLARTLLELVASMGAMTIMLATFWLTGIGNFPVRPWFIVYALLIMTMLSGGVAMIIAGAGEMGSLVERFVHPATYLVLPFSGLFFVLGALPARYASFMSWFVLPQITDIARMGLVDTYDSQYINLPYVFGLTAAFWMIGLAWLRYARRKMHFD